MAQAKNDSILQNEDKPDGYADYRARFGRIFSSRWVNTFMKRHGLSIRKPTNRKKTDVFQRMHKIENYTHYTIYEMGLDPPSDVSDEGRGWQSQLCFFTIMLMIIGILNSTCLT